jgi:hypothetical protein
VQFRRFRLLAILLYVGLDLCLPDMPGAFVFDADGSVQSVEVARSRPTGKIVVLVSPATGCPQSSGPSLRDDDHPRPLRGPAAPRGHRMTSYLPRARCTSAPAEDSH